MKIMAMSKSEVRVIETKARMLMKLDNQIWKKFGWKSGGDVDMGKFKEEVRKKVKSGSLHYIYYHIFEDANYHSLNNALEETGAFTGTYADAQEKFDEYGRAGGKTWNV